MKALKERGIIDRAHPCGDLHPCLIHRLLQEEDPLLY